MARQWNPFTRWRRNAAAAEGAVVAPSASPSPLLVQPDQARPVASPALAPALPAKEPADTAGVALEAEAQELRRLRFFGWLVDTPVSDASVAPAAFIPQMFEAMDQVIASETARAALLPRAPHVVPQLMKTLRDESYSSVDVAGRISKDVVLTAEVVRSATSAFQRGNDDDGTEIDLSRAVTMIGTQGLRRAIASVVLRPIFDARGDTLSARAATQIWKDADCKARLASVLAAQAGLDPFDGYLAGLLHNSGWTAALRAIDGLPILTIHAGDLAHPEVLPQLLRRRDALFGALVEPWALSPAMDRLAAEVGSVGLDAVQSPLGLALRDAERLSALHLLAPVGQRPAAAVPMWATLAKPVQDCYVSLSRG
jgi:hypothetical protein